MRQKVSLGVSKFWYAYCQSLVRTYWLQSVSTRLSFFTAVFSTNTYWYNLANIQDAITLFFSQILEFCMWSDNQEELMKESKVWNILKNANKKKIRWLHVANILWLGKIIWDKQNPEILGNWNQSQGNWTILQWVEVNYEENFLHFQIWFKFMFSKKATTTSQIFESWVKLRMGNH